MNLQQRIRRRRCCGGRRQCALESPTTAGRCQAGSFAPRFDGYFWRDIVRLRWARAFRWALALHLPENPKVRL